MAVPDSVFVSEYDLSMVVPEVMVRVCSHCQLALIALFEKTLNLPTLFLGSMKMTYALWDQGLTGQQAPRGLATVWAIAKSMVYDWTIEHEFDFTAKTLAVNVIKLDILTRLE
jgi:hypothetical protein